MLKRAFWAGIGVVIVVLVLWASLWPRARAPHAVSKPASPEKLAAELNILNWSEYLPESVIKKFEKKYRVKVNYDTYSSSEELFAKIQAGAGNYDLIVPGDYMVHIMIKQGLLAPLDKANTPNLKNIDPAHLDRYFDPGNRYTVPYMWGTVGIAYNSAKIPNPPRSNPNLAARAIMPENLRNNPAAYPPASALANVEWVKDVGEVPFSLTNSGPNSRASSKRPFS